MDYKAPAEIYNGRIAELVIGEGDRAVRIGGENVLPLHSFEGVIQNPPRIALEIWDSNLHTWPETLREPYRDVLSDPIAWARKCLDYKADIICVRLVSTDPQGENAPPERTAEKVKKIVDSVNAPIIVYGSGDESRDVQVLTRVAEVCAGARLLLGPAVKENYEPIAKAALEYGHSVIAQTPIDINLEKELNVKLLKSLPPDRIVIDPLSSALGYGMEYSFTIMERTKHIGIIFGDRTMQMPIIADLGSEAWKTKQAKGSGHQGIMWESVSALSLLLAGANILVLRHPESCRYIKDVIAGKL
jgi:acetyl-CoA decarbonylase/synthase complex subunit delta